MFDASTPEPSLQLEIECKEPNVQPFIHLFLKTFGTFSDKTHYRYNSDVSITQEKLCVALPSYLLNTVNLTNLRPGFLGLLQCMVILLLLKPSV
jgi:hypothetical protein